MIYVLLSYLFYPFLNLITSLRRKTEIKKILVIQTAKIGDMICSTPVFREIKKKYPDVHLTVMVSPVTKELLDYNPNVDEVIVTKNTDYKRLSGKFRLSSLIQKGHYDIAICFNPNVPFAIAMAWGLVPIRISVMPDFAGTTFKLASVFFTHLEKHVKGRLVIETCMEMLKTIGIESNNMSREVYKLEDADKKVRQTLQDVIPVKLVLEGSNRGTGIQKKNELDSPIKSGNDNVCLPPKQTDKHLIGIAISSGNKLKELGVEKTTTLTNTLLDDIDAYIIFIGSEQDRNTANTILNSISKKNRVIDTVGKLSLAELPALIERLSLFIGVDTGITYMADALSVPLIVIAGPSDMSDQRPLGKNSIIIQRKDISCIPCSHTYRAPYSCDRGDRICITSVSVSEIMEAVRKLLNLSFPPRIRVRGQARNGPR